MSTARVQISPSAPRRSTCSSAKRRLVMAVFLLIPSLALPTRRRSSGGECVGTYCGEIPKWFKGPVLKTGRWVTPTQGFESLSLRHTKSLEIVRFQGFYFLNPQFQSVIVSQNTHIQAFVLSAHTACILMGCLKNRD